MRSPGEMLTDLLCNGAARLIVAAVVVVGLVTLLITHTAVPDAYWAVTGAVVGFYFGGNVRSPAGGN